MMHLVSKRVRRGDLDLRPLDFEKTTRVTRGIKALRIYTLNFSVVGFSVLKL